MALLAAIWNRRGGRFLLLAVGFVVAFQAARLVTSEIDKRLLAAPLLQPPEWQIRRQAVQLTEVVEPDDYLGFVLASNREYAIESLDFSFLRATGIRGFPIFGSWPEAAEVVFLGDSLLLGAGVGAERSFVAQLDRAWRDKRVVNLGNPGAGPERQLRIFERFGLGLKPSLVVACLYLAADLENDTHFHAWLTDSLGMEYNEFRLSYQRRTDLRPKDALSRRLERRPLFGWAQSMIEPHLWGAMRIPHRMRFAEGSEIFFSREKVQFARQPYGGDEPELERVLNSIERLRRLVGDNGGALAVVLIPSKEEVYAAPNISVVNAPRRLQRRLEDGGVAVLDLAPMLRQRASDRPAYYRRDIHLTEFGNDIAADVMREWLEQRFFRGKL